MDLTQLKESLFAQSAKRQSNISSIGRALARPKESCSRRTEESSSVRPRSGWFFKKLHIFSKSYIFFKKLHIFLHIFRKVTYFSQKVTYFSLALFQLKRHTISRLRMTSLGSKSTLKPCDLPAESGMPVLRTTTLVRICTQTRPYIPNGNIDTFSFGVEGFSLNLPKRERSQGNPAFCRPPQSDILEFRHSCLRRSNTKSQKCAYAIRISDYRRWTKTTQPAFTWAIRNLQKMHNLFVVRNFCSLSGASTNLPECIIMYIIIEHISCVWEVIVHIPIQQSHHPPLPFPFDIGVHWLIPFQYKKQRVHVPGAWTICPYQLLQHAQKAALTLNLSRIVHTHSKSSPTARSLLINSLSKKSAPFSLLSIKFTS